MAWNKYPAARVSGLSRVLASISCDVEVLLLSLAYRGFLPRSLVSRAVLRIRVESVRSLADAYGSPFRRRRPSLLPLRRLGGCVVNTPKLL